MKKLYLVILMALFSVIQAQNISFTDQNFKNKLLSSNPGNQIAKNLAGSFFAADANQDNEISLSEAVQISYLDISSSGISNLYNIGSFSNLNTLKCQGNVLTSALNLSSLDNLQRLECQNNQLTSVTISNPVYVNTANNNLTAIYFPGNTDNLTYVDIRNNQIAGFTTLEYPSLTDFYADGNPITTLKIYRTALIDFVLHPITHLQELYFYSSFSGTNYTPTSFTVDNFPNLKTISGYGIKPVNGLNLSNLPALNYANVTGPDKITVKNINPSIMPSGLNLLVDEFHENGTSNSSIINRTSVRAKRYYFENLTSVDNLSYKLDSEAAEVHFNNLPVLDTLDLSTYQPLNGCIDFDFSAIGSLKKLKIDDIKYNSINVSNLNQLKILQINAPSCNPVASIVNISGLPQLEYISIKDQFLKTININSLSILKDIKIYGPGYSSVNIGTLPQLQDFLLDTTDKPTTNPIHLLDFNNFPNLKNITLMHPVVTAINFNNLPNLKTFTTGDINYTATSEVPAAYNFSNLPSLENIILNNANISPLTLNNLPALKNITIKRTLFAETYTFQNLPLLEDVTIEYPQISAVFLKNLAFNNLPQIKNITLKDFYYLNSLDLGNINTTLENFSLKNDISVYGSLNTLSFNNFPQLKKLDVQNNLTSLQLSNLPQLHTLNVTHNKFTNLTIASLPALENFTSNSNILSSPYNITFSNLPVLKVVDVSNNGNNLRKIDLSEAPQLEKLYFKASFYGTSPSLDYINLKNGNPNMLLMDTGYFKNICVDDDNERAQLQSLQSNLANTVFTSYCSLSPAGSNYKVEGKTNFDINNNGCDPSDPKFSNLKLGINTGGILSTFTANQNGLFSIPLQAGIHSITPILENPAYFNIFPTNLTVNFPAQISPLTQNFCVSANGTHNDLEIMIIPVTDAAPGFDAQYKIVYKNKGTASQSGNIVFNFNNNLMLYKSATIAPSSQSTGLVNWNFTNLLPFETREITVTVKLNTPTQTPPVNGGDILHYSAQINGAADETPADNNFALNQIAVNSFDPNDKICLEGSSISQTQVGDYVHYLIRFENTGTANAKNIVVKDEIDTSKFDLSSLIALNGSHNFVTRITNPNVVEFIFENIQLPFDDANNDGYVSFKIKTKSNLATGNSFSNTAKIYFDYNHPIITNTYTTTVQGTLAISEIKSDKNGISIYPNPVKDLLYIQSKNVVTKAEIYDITGRIIISTGVQEKSVNVSELPKGNYIIKLYTKENITPLKFIKQ
nr:T9SS type A sorting domain-containing protein [uncultured Chryseobacterium sp.]